MVPKISERSWQKLQIETLYVSEKLRRWCSDVGLQNG